jgi:hypothetical protein
MAPAGRFWNYSNPNFSLAGLMLERSSGQYYRDYLDQNVFTPLGMDRTFFLGSEVLDDGDYASGATTNWTTGVGDAVATPDAYDSVSGRPAGFAWSIVHDLAAFAQFLMDGDDAVLSDGLVADMQTHRVSMEYGYPTYGYGYGLFVYEGFFLGEDWYEDLTLVSHGGDIMGFAADLYMIPELGVGCAALASADGAHLGYGIIDALSLADLPAPGTPPDMSVYTSTFPDFAGSYDDPWNVGPMDVAVDGTSVTVTFPLLDDLGYDYDSNLYSYTPDNFVLDITGLQILLSFIRDDEGVVEYARTRYFVAEKIPDAASAAPRAVTADPTGLPAAIARGAPAEASLMRFLKPQPR